VIAVLVFHREFIKNIPLMKKNAQKFLLPLLVGFFYTTGNNLYGFALKEIPAYLGSAIFNAYPLATVLWGYIYLKERLKLIQLIGVCIIVGGLVITAFS
jgi:drug/metabolite transporter (DMT)-like permease